MGNLEFKFRAWDGKHWWQVKWVDFKDGKPVLIEGHPLIDNVAAAKGTLSDDEIKAFVQYTGRMDMNGTEIYAGDIVAYDTEDGIYAATVEWADDVYPDRDLSPIVGPGYLFVDPFQVREYEDDEDAIGLEVIGNIHENPGLAGKQS